MRQIRLIIKFLLDPSPMKPSLLSLLVTVNPAGLEEDDRPISNIICTWNVCCRENLLSSSPAYSPGFTSISKSGSSEELWRHRGFQPDMIELRLLPTPAGG